MLPTFLNNKTEKNLIEKQKDFIQLGLEELRNRPYSDQNEAEVRRLILDEAIPKIFDVPKTEIRTEVTSQGTGLTPDYVLMDQNGAAKFIIEAKAYGVDIFKNRNPDDPLKKYPMGQLINYLEGHELSREGTVGILSNGHNWVVMKRGSNWSRLEKQFRAENYLDLYESLHPFIVGGSLKLADRDFIDSESPWLKTLRELYQENLLEQPVQILGSLVNKPTDSMIQNKDASSAYCQMGSYSDPDLPLVEGKVFCACLKFKSFDGLFSPSEISDRLQENNFSKLSISIHDRIYGVAFISNRNEDVKVRGFYRNETKLLTTELFELHNPKAINAKRIRELSDHRVYEQDEWNGIIPSMSLSQKLAEFHQLVDRWFANTSQQEHILQHLIQLMFVYLLIDRDILPRDCLFPPDLKQIPEFAIHRHVLWVFSELLATQEDDRLNGRSVEDLTSLYTPLNSEIEGRLSEEVPFLNGSMFSRIISFPSEDSLTNDQYTNSNGDFPGILDIFQRYQWTLTEETGYESEMAINPNVIGQLFERLIISVEGVRLERGGSREKMPDGTYYTPSELAEEMAADALANFLRSRIDCSPPLNEIRASLHSTPDCHEWTQWDRFTKKKLVSCLREATILDPCCGSGVFPVAILQCIHRFEKRMNSDSKAFNSFESLSRIIEKQLYSVDKKPLALLVTKLRLYISLIDSQPKTSSVKPLPNLGVRHIPANTLYMNVHGEGSVFKLDLDPDWQTALGELNAHRELWITDAQTEKEKIDFKKDDQMLRARLQEIGLSAGIDSGDLQWLDLDLMSDVPTKGYDVDVRSLFGVTHWDIVIGNPPFQKITQQDELVSGTGYVTKDFNLYTLFFEVALQTSKNDGIITFVVPHSITVGSDARLDRLRKLIQSTCTSVNFRTFSNRPQPLFPKQPHLRKNKGGSRGKENSQRCTVLTLHKGTTTCKIFSQGYICLSRETRSTEIRKQREPIIQNVCNDRWTHAPTNELRELLSKMFSTELAESPLDSNISLQQVRFANFPKAPRYFITVMPRGDVDCSSRSQNWDLPIPNTEPYWAWIGLFNSRVFFAYWLMTGNYHQTSKGIIKKVRRPPGWKSKSVVEQTETFSKQLTLSEKLRLQAKTNGNWNWFQNNESSSIVREIDRLVLRAYGLPEQPLLKQVEELRFPSHLRNSDYELN